MNGTKAQKFMGIQVLRIVAACLVVFTHSTFYAFERLDRSFSVWNNGANGVHIFFVVSGFVMIYSSQRLLNSPDGWRIFAERRIVRIVPLYWLVTSLKVAIMLCTAGFALHTILSPATAIYSYLFLPARNLDGRIEPLVGVGWTLNFEMLFYCLFTLALFLRVSVFKFVGVILFILSVGAYFRNPSWPPIAFYLNPIILEFYLGMLIAQVCIKGVCFPKRAAPLLLAFGLAILLFHLGDLRLPLFLISGVPASLVVWSVVSLHRLDQSIPGWVLYLGDASYAIYLVHPFVCPLPPTVLMRLHMDHPWLAVALSVVLGVGCGCALHQMVEIPLTNWLKSYLNARQRPLQAVA